MRARTLLIHGVLFLLVIRGSGVVAGLREGASFDTALDQALPLVPQAVWVYILLYIFPVLLLLAWRRGISTETKSHQVRFVIALWIATLAAAACYIAWPLRFPYAEGPDTISGQVLNALLSQDFDPPASKFPAFHATLPLLCCLAIRHAFSRPFMVVAWALATAISVSAFLIKQHLVIDVVAGAALAFAAWGLSGLRRGAAS